MRKSLTIPTEDLAKIYPISGGQLLYKDKSRYGIVSGDFTSHKTISVLDLYGSLKNRRWNFPIIETVSSKGHLAKSISKINDSTIDSTGVIRNRAIVSSPISLISTLQEDIEREDSGDYGDIAESNIKEAVDELSNFLKENKDVLDSEDIISSDSLFDGPITFDVVSSDQFTNIVSLESIVQKCSSYPKSIAKAQVMYSKGDSIFSKNEIFRLVNTQNGSIIENEFIRNINGDVELEFVNGVLRLMPIAKDVIECIINNCTITYGKL